MDTKIKKGYMPSDGRTQTSLEIIHPASHRTNSTRAARSQGRKVDAVVRDAAPVDAANVFVGDIAVLGAAVILGIVVVPVPVSDVTEAIGKLFVLVLSSLVRLISIS